jgi:DNA-binding FadR family transcriptional regulator
MEREASRFYSLSDFAYEKILANIIGGAFQQGERLPAEDALATRLGVSRPIVREALARLREEGLIVSRRGSGSYVVGQPARTVEAFSPVSSITDMQQCFEFRLEFESIAAYHAAQRRTEEDMANIETALNVWNDLRDRGIAAIQEDFDFHASICKASYNRFFIETLDFLKDNICTGMNLSRNLSLQRPTERTRAVQNEHAAIAAAVRAKDGPAAQEAMRRHIGTARTRVFEGVGRSGNAPVL